MAAPSPTLEALVQDELRGPVQEIVRIDQLAETMRAVLEGE